MVDHTEAKEKALKSETPSQAKPIREPQGGGEIPRRPVLYHRGEIKMKWYDILFIIAAAAALWAVDLDREGLKALISGVLIGVYGTVRFHDIRRHHDDG